MVLSIAIIVLLLVAIPGGLYWLLRPRKDVQPGPFHQNDSAASRLGTGHSVGGDGGHAP